MFASIGDDGRARSAFHNPGRRLRKHTGEVQEGRNIVRNRCDQACPVDELDRGDPDEPAMLRRRLP